LSFAPSAAALKHFEKELKGHKTTQHFLQIRYAEPLPEDLIRRIAEFCLSTLKARKDDSFWPS
jgi:uncharacterized protein YdhG (YjbR/CyaY superfamily)